MCMSLHINFSIFFFLSPVTEIKNASLPMRTNLKQQLQRQQLLDQEKREHDAAAIAKLNGLASHINGSGNITVPRMVESTEVPTNVLQVFFSFL